MLLALSFVASAARATPSSEELVRQARAHEAAREQDLAVRRYMEALELDVTTEDAWLGLGALRMRLGEPAEAMRVYEAALVRLPALHAALAGRAGRALRALGKRAEAEAALETYAAVEGQRRGAPRARRVVRQRRAGAGAAVGVAADPAHGRGRGGRAARARGPPDGAGARHLRGWRRPGPPLPRRRTRRAGGFAAIARRGG